MKNFFIIRSWAMLLTASLFLASCEQEEGLETQPHDQNKMMTIMHQMMTQMEAMPMNSEPDIDFAKMMVMHHQGAINMAQEEIANGKDAEMIAIAQKIKSEQEKEIQEFNTFLASYQADQPMNMEFHMEVMESMEKMGRESDLRVITGDTDQDFAQLMIPHHQAAMENAKSVIEHGNSPVIKTMAQKIIDSQMMDIKELQEWLLEHKEY
ncbi:DUF305 domain-containing protein [Adhaeribacter rhizoryzae]|uniref:DUF305 domain-containing protein n=1 Tax=Adhaeribacter rhizoryzae TaxID=2607907 RepID=A0A5M6D3H3_9BACT|nr:DUF305 domain-containing protein [Adhaeribacter rhizoryzae]KAA5542047.1 DUF305 domain-containing protein [Adhaeribacter rhizoryzae]